jgi:short-subunit dehydrogenase
LRQEAGDKLRVTIISPGFVRTNFADGVTNPEVKAQLAESRDKFAMPPDAIARAIAFAIEQPADIDVNEIINSPHCTGVARRPNSANQYRKTGFSIMTAGKGSTRAYLKGREPVMRIWTSLLALGCQSGPNAR